MMSHSEADSLSLAALHEPIPALYPALALLAVVAVALIFCYLSEPPSGPAPGRRAGRGRGVKASRIACGLFGIPLMGGWARIRPG